MMTQRHISQLQKIVDQLQRIVTEAKGAALEKRPAPTASNSRTKGTRRTATQVGKMKKEIAAARRRGERVADLAKKFGVTTSYIYQL